MIINYSELIYDVLLLAGMWVFMKKCGINPKLAFVPGYRFYKVADTVEMEEEGFTLMTLYIVLEMIRLGTFYLQKIGHNLTRTTVVLMVPLLVISMACAVYRFRIGGAICDNMSSNKKHRWVWCMLWMFAPALPLLLMGLIPKYQMQKPEETGTAADVSGKEAKMLKSGLTINLTDRSVKNHLKTRYLLKDIHMNITPNKMVLLLGGSGAGKTTFLNAITGYEKANATVTLNGADVYKNFNRMKYQIGFVPQQDLIRYEDTVLRTLTDAASLRLPTEYSRKEKKQRVNEVLDIFGLNPVKNNLVSKQSGGQKKRISIATEFISDPTLFILDEPDSGLDGILARELMQYLHDISRQNRIVIVITHTPDRVIDLFDEVIVLGKDANRTGRLVFHGSIEDARSFFQVEKMEEIVKKINCVDEGGEGMTDELIEKYEGGRHGE